MKRLASFPLCCVDLPDILANPTTNASLTGASIYIQTRKRQEIRERETARRHEDIAQKIFI